MQLSMFSDYALRVLMHLAMSPDRLMSTRQIADIHQAKYNHLAKVTAWLVTEGYAEALRGRAGGLKLAKPPEQINVGDVMQKLEADKPLVECLGADGGTCCLSTACGLTLALQTAQTAFYQSLQTYTLADVTKLTPNMQSLIVALNLAPTTQNTA